MSDTPRPAARWLATGLLCALGAGVAVAAPEGASTQAAPGQAVPVPVLTEGVGLLANLPVPAAISMEFARTGEFAYVSSTTGIYTLDTSDPEAPRVLGVLPTVNFENESMTYGERRGADGELERFVLLAVDLVEAGAGLDPADPDPGSLNVGGLEVVVVDVTDPTAPFVRGRGPATTSTHTAQCLSQEQCDYAYTAGDGGAFSIIDLRDPSAPVELTTVRSPAAGPGGSGFADGAGHYWDVDGAGVAWHTGSGGTAAFDVTDPTAPVLLAATGPQGRAPGLNDFIHHNSRRPNAERFVPGAEPSLANGNVLLVTEEDYFDGGEEVVCANAGSFQTWYVPDLDGAAYRAANPTGDVQDVGTITNLDAVQAPTEFGGGLSTPAAAFCSAHWFDVHQDGFVAQGWYGAGLRILDVRDPREIAQLGYATFGATEVWDAYWVPLRDEAGVVTGRKSDLVYTTDAVRGVDVFEVALPAAPTGPEAPEGPQQPGGTGGTTGTAGATGTSGTTGGSGTTGATGRRGALAATGLPLLLPAAGLVLLLGGAVVQRRRPLG